MIKARVLLLSKTLPHEVDLPCCIYPALNKSFVAFLGIEDLIQGLRKLKGNQVAVLFEDANKVQGYKNLIPFDRDDRPASLRKFPGFVRLQKPRAITYKKPNYVEDLIKQLMGNRLSILDSGIYLSFIYSISNAANARNDLKQSIIDVFFNGCTMDSFKGRMALVEKEAPAAYKAKFKKEVVKICAFLEGEKGQQLINFFSELKTVDFGDDESIEALCSKHEVSTYDARYFLKAYTNAKNGILPKDVKGKKRAAT